MLSERSNKKDRITEHVQDMAETYVSLCEDREESLLTHDVYRDIAHDCGCSLDNDTILKLVIAGAQLAVFEEYMKQLQGK